MDSCDFVQIRVVRRLGPWSIEAARYCSLVNFLVAVDHEARTVVGCSYPDDEEFARGLALLQSIPPGDTGNAGVLAPLIPTHPASPPAIASRFPV